MANNLSYLRNCNAIGIMGGTFDPIHYGHLAAAEAVRYEFGVEKIIFIPTGIPAHKEEESVTDSKHRFLMTTLATADNPNFNVSTIEIDRVGHSYTVDTITEIREYCNDDAVIYFIMGADSLHQIYSWKNIEKLFKICEIIVVPRPGYKKSALLDEIKMLQKKVNKKVHYLEVNGFDISSTDIKYRIKRNSAVRYMLPPNVLNYIIKEGLYVEKHEFSQEFLDTITFLKKKLKRTLSLHRYKHTISVMNEACRLCTYYNKWDYAEKAMLAGILHDCAKDIPIEVQKSTCKDYSIKIDDNLSKSPKVIHQFLGAEIARREYNIKEEEVINAIRFHTTGRPNMGFLEKIVFLADFIEPERKSTDEIVEAKRLASIGLDVAIEYVLNTSINYLKEHKQPVYTLTLDAYEFYKDAHHKNIGKQL